MTDVTTINGPAAQMAVENAPPAASPAPAVAPERTDFDKQLDDFLGHSFFDGSDGFEPAPAPELKTVEPAPVAPITEAPVAPAAPAPSPAGTPAPNVEPTTGAAPTPAGTPGQPTQAELAAMFGLGAPAPVGQPGTAPTPAPAAAPAPTPPAAPEAWTPFDTNFQIPTGLQSALFESEDPATRSQALVHLLSGFGNAVAQIVEHRIREHHAPQIAAAALQTSRETTTRESIVRDIYSNFEDLKPFGPQLIAQAFKAVASTMPAGTPYSEEIRNKVGNLARTYIRQIGLQTGAPSPAPAPALAPAPTPSAPFIAGGARPEGGPAGGPTDVEKAFIDLSSW